jgi:Na+/proline symporter
MMVWAYLTLCVILGFFKIPKMQSLKDYAIGSNQFSTTVLTLSMIATFVGPAETIGVVGKSFSMGTIFTSTCILHALKWFIMGKVLSSSITYLKMNHCYTLVDIMRLFYGKWGRYVCVATLLLSIAILSIFYKAAAIVLERYLNIPFIHGAAIITITIAVYSIFGGMHAITITDVVQFFIFVIVIPAVFIIGLQNLDFQTAINNLPPEKMYITEDNIGLFLSLLAYELIPVTGFPYVQRGLMSSSPQQVKNIFGMVGIFSSAFALMLCTIGMVVAGMNPDLQGDDALFYFIDNAVPPSIMGFVAVSFLAIIMSTASSFLNSITVVIIKDVLTPLVPQLANDRKQLILTRFSGTVIAIASFGIMFIKDQILDLLWTMDNFWDPFISIPLIMGLMGIRIQHENFKYVVMSALASVLVARYFNGSFDTVTLCAGVFVSCVMMLVYRDKSIEKAGPDLKNHNNILTSTL